jgi:hypothetical protein
MPAVGLEPGHKPDTILGQLIRPGIIQVGPVKDQQVVRLEVQVLAGLAVMSLAVGDQDTLGCNPVRMVWSLMAPLRVRNLAQGKTVAQRSMGVASTILRAFCGCGANSVESRSSSL